MLEVWFCLRAYCVCRAGFAGRGVPVARITERHSIRVLPRPKTQSWVGLLICAVAFAGCRQDVEKAAAPAKVENPTHEADLTTVELSTDAFQRLGITVAPVEQRTLRRRRTFGGEIVLPIGAPAGSSSPSLAVGAVSAAPDRLRTAEALLGAEGELRRATVELAAAEQAVRRAEEVLRGGSGTARGVEEAHARRDAARAARDTARRRYDLLAGAIGGVPTIERWVRASVPADDLDTIELTASAEVGTLAARPGTAVRAARPVPGVRSANPDAGTVDVVYAIEGDGGELWPGERVGVTLPLREEGEALVVPWAAVLHDVHGGEWVYEQLAPQRFARRRVQVRFVADDVAALASGPAAGRPVVVDGAAELFGTEFGVGK